MNSSPSESVLPHWSLFHTLIFDFDGVFTDNKVYLNANCEEFVCCDRADGLAFDLLRKFVNLNNWNLSCFLLSTEKNKVVAARASKLQLECIQGVDSKSKFVTSYLASKNLSSSGLMYVGNDLNDLFAMRLAGFSVSPCDAHPMICSNADVVLGCKGGDSFVRTLIELLLEVDKMPLSYLEKLL